MVNNNEIKSGIFKKQNIRGVTIIPGSCGNGYYIHIRYNNKDIDANVRLDSLTIEEALDKIKQEISA